MLKGKRCYLSGPITYQAYDWRPPLLEILKKFEIDVFDPFRDPKQQWVDDLNAAIKQENEDEMERVCRMFVRKDLAIVDRTDFLVACLPLRCPTVGTHHEIINANNAKKPTLLYCPEGRFHIPPWYWGFIPSQYFFGSVDGLERYLQAVDDGIHKDDNRWHLAYELI